MKAILVFELPEDQQEYHLALNGAKISCEIIDACEQIRVWSKYGNNFSGVQEALDACRALLSSAYEISMGEGW